MEKGFEISWTSLWRIVGILLLVSVFYIALDVWLAVFLAIVISSALDPIVSWLNKRKIPRVIGTLGVFIAAILATALLLYTIVPLAISEFTILLKNLGKLEYPILGFDDIAKTIGDINKSLGQFANILLSGSAPFLGVVSRFIGGAVLTSAVFVLSFYLTVYRDGVEKLLRAIIPMAYEERVLDVYSRTRKKIGRWLYGQMILSVSVGLAAFLGLWLIGVKYSLLLAVLTGILEIVPYAGPILSGSLAAVIALSQSPTTSLYVILLYFLINQAENLFLVPTVARLITSLNPAVILVSLLIGGKLFGIVGMVLAVPIAVTLQEFVDYWSNEKNNRRKVSSPGV